VSKAREAIFSVAAAIQFVRQSPHMGVFLCWSGEKSRSHQIAKILYKRIPEILQTANTFLSSLDIAPGTEWMDELKQALNSNSFGILCITPENKDYPWLHFEAGALWRGGEKDRRVCPLLYDIRPAEISGPLSQLQGKELLNRDAFFDVVKAVNQYGALHKIEDQSRLTVFFDRVWPNIQKDLSKVKKPLNLTKQPEGQRALDEKAWASLLSTLKDADVLKNPAPQESLVGMVLSIEKLREALGRDVRGVSKDSSCRPLFEDLQEACKEFLRARDAIERDILYNVHNLRGSDDDQRYGSAVRGGEWRWPSNKTGDTITSLKPPIRQIDICSALGWFRGRFSQTLKDYESRFRPQASAQGLVVVPFRT
jgi:hypothetical protein